MHNAWIRPSSKGVPRGVLSPPLATLRSKARAWSTISVAWCVIVLEPLTSVNEEANFKRRRFERFLCLVSELTAKRPGQAVLSAAGDGVSALP